MKLICSRNIFSNKVNEYIYNIISSNNNYLYLTNSTDVNYEREKSEILNKLFKNNNSIMQYENFLKLCSNNIYKSKNYLPNIDIVYILEKIIDNYFTDEKSKKQFQNLRYNLYDLYKLMIFNNVKFISKSKIELIQRENSLYEFYIFDIYNKLFYIVTDIVSSFANGKRVYSNESLDIEILAPDSVNENFDIFINAYKKQIYKIISSIDILILDGFFILNEQLYFIVKTAVELNKEVIIITKDLQTDKNAEFLVDEIKEKIHLKNN